MMETLTKPRRSRFWFLFAFLMALIMARYALQLDIPRILFLIVVAAIALWGDRDEIIAICMCLIPMHESLDFFYAMVICFAVYVFKYHQQLRFGTNVILVVLIAVWELLHCFFTPFSIVFFLTCVIPFIILAILIASDLKNIDYPFIVRAFAWSVLGVSIMLFVRVLYFANFNIALALAGLQRMGLDNQSNVEDVEILGGQIHPNSLGVIAVLASTGLMQLRHLKVSQTSDIVIMCIIIVFAALSASRTYLACLALMVILLIFSEKGDFKRKIRLTVTLGLTIATAVIAFIVLFPDTFLYYISRFFVTDISTGRDALFARYNEFIIDNPRVLFFGVGLQDYGDRLVYLYRVAANVPHNLIQEIVVSWGIPGLILFSGQIISMFGVSYRKNPNQSLINWIPLIIILFKGMAGQIITSPYTMLAISFAYLSLSQDLSGTEEPNDQGYNSVEQPKYNKNMF